MYVGAEELVQRLGAWYIKQGPSPHVEGQCGPSPSSVEGWREEAHFGSLVSQPGSSFSKGSYLRGVR